MDINSLREEARKLGVPNYEKLTRSELCREMANRGIYHKACNILAPGFSPPTSPKKRSPPKSKRNYYFSPSSPKRKSPPSLKDKPQKSPSPIRNYRFSPPSSPKRSSPSPDRPQRSPSPSSPSGNQEKRRSRPRYRSLSRSPSPKHSPRTSPGSPPKPIVKRRTRSPERRSPKKRISYSRSAKSRSRSRSRPPSRVQKVIKPRKLNEYLQQYLPNINYPLERYQFVIPDSVKNDVVIPKRSIVLINNGKSHSLDSQDEEGFTFIQLLEIIWNDKTYPPDNFLGNIFYINHDYYMVNWGMPMTSKNFLRSRQNKK